jgi:hypothetical protein
MTVIEIKEVQEEVFLTINNQEIEAKVNLQKIPGMNNKNHLKVKFSK